MVFKREIINWEPKSRFIWKTWTIWVWRKEKAADPSFHISSRKKTRVFLWNIWDPHINHGVIQKADMWQHLYLHTMLLSNPKESASKTFQKRQYPHQGYDKGWHNLCRESCVMWLLSQPWGSLLSYFIHESIYLIIHSFNHSHSVDLNTLDIHHLPLFSLGISQNPLLFFKALLSCWSAHVVSDP